MTSITVLVLPALLLSVVSVHYLEESMLPVVMATRLAVYGERLDTSPPRDCETLKVGAEWVHPTTLALTAYGAAQKVLGDEFGKHSPEVLPDYASTRRETGALLCVADYLYAVGERRSMDGLAVRIFRFDMPYEKYGLASGWVSGLTQGLVGQVFMGAFVLTSDHKYLDAARETGHLLDVKLDDGGVKVAMPDGTLWYEEYAQPGAEPPLVLNGHLLALDFLYWMMQLDDDPVWGEMFERGVRATVAQIDHYQGFGWSYYDQKSNFATRKYQTFHVRQLERYANHDETGILSEARDKMRWQLFVPVGIFQRLIAQPSRMLAFLTALFFVIYLPTVWIVSRIVMSKRAA